MNDIEFSGFVCYSVKSNVARSPISGNLNCLLLESDPTPDYYANNNFPEHKHLHDWHLYLPIKKQVVCFQDIVLRNAPLIGAELKSNLKIAPGQIYIQNKNHACIRVNTQNTNQLPFIINEFEDLGIQFYADKKLAQFESLIYYKKYTEFLKIGEGFYQDVDEENRHFFEVPHQINFDEFLIGIEKIKNNCNYHLFDSFLSSIFLKDTTQDFIGIYSEHCNKERFGELAKEIVKVFN